MISDNDSTNGGTSGDSMYSVLSSGDEWGGLIYYDWIRYNGQNRGSTLLKFTTTNDHVIYSDNEYNHATTGRTNYHVGNSFDNVTETGVHSIPSYVNNPVGNDAKTIIYKFPSLMLINELDVYQGYVQSNPRYSTDDIEILYDDRGTTEYSNLNDLKVNNNWTFVTPVNGTATSPTAQFDPSTTYRGELLEIPINVILTQQIKIRLLKDARVNNEGNDGPGLSEIKIYGIHR